MRAVLIGSSGLVLGREYPLDASVVTIGRRDENMIVIKDPTVSRKHAEIRREGEGLVIVDKGSTSGITVNGQAINGPHPLRDGDRIGIGSSAVFLIQMQPVEDKTISFAQQQFAESGRTQFITRDLGDPRGVPSANPQQGGGQAAPRPGETMIQSTPFTPSAPPPPSPRSAPANPPSPAPSFSSPPAAAPVGQGWGEPPRVEQAVPDFTPPRPSVDLGGPPLAPPTVVDMPRSRSEVSPPPGQSPVLPDFSPRFDAPPPPDGNLPPISAVTEFAPNNSSNPGNPMLGGPAPQFGNQPPPPQFGAPPPQFGSAPPQFGGSPQFDNPPPQFGNQQPQFGGPAPQFGNQPSAPSPMMSPPPPPTSAAARGGRPGLVIALIAVVILVLIAAVVVGLLLTGKLG